MKAILRSERFDSQPLCEQLPVRDYLDNVLVRTNGALVAGYELRGIHSYFASDEERNQSKLMLDALLRTLPEQSMRLQLRFEMVEDLGNLLDRYHRQTSQHEVVRKLDEIRLRAWCAKEAEGQYLRPLLHAYLIWDPRIHREANQIAGRWKRPSWSLSAEKCIQRERREHERLVEEFETLLSGIESTMQAANLGARRMDDDELFVEARRALSPLENDTRPYKSPDELDEFRSAREQLVDVSLLDETESYLNIDGLLHSVVSLKELPDATFPGILRQLAALDFPLVANVQITIPDQAKALKTYKSRLRKMQAAQRDSRGGFRVNVEAQVAEGQLFRVQQDIISSSVRTAKLSMVIVTRTSRPARTMNELERAETVVNDRCQQVLHAVARMNGAKAVMETLAKKRLFFCSLPGMGELDKREQDMLTTNAADLLPMETPWQGTQRSPLILVESPYRQLIPFSPFDPSLSDANLVAMAKTGGGKTFMVQQLLLMMSRDNPLISIIEAGDSYQPLVEMMGGRMISMSLDSDQRINPWDLPKGDTEPSKDKIAFLKNLTRHMLGEGRAEDTELLDNVLTEAIARVYKRAAIRASNPIPTFSDLRDELAQWRDEDRNQRVMDEAHLASVKLRTWTGEKGVYSRLVDEPTTVSLDDDWLFFNVEQLKHDARLDMAMSMLIAHATAQRASGKSGRRSITVLDECWFLLDSPTLAPEVVQLFRTARKRNASVWGISQAMEDLVGTQAKPRIHGPGIIKNTTTKMVGQQPGDLTALRDELHLNDTALNQIKHLPTPLKGRSADALIVIGERAETTHVIRMVPTPIEYWITTTYPRERSYRTWFLGKHKELPLLAAYQELATRFPFGLGDLANLPEEESGEVLGWKEKR